ncbi:hypothetical protein AX17_005916 [Amanita inopinata Kibby_2008]|nr:hypothetical protein AX17_005916 [Amanita inopinata Kibby_2008]
MASPFFFIKKKDRSLRLVQDYRALNTMMVKNRYPIPLISDLINQLHGTQYFTKLDVCWGYNNGRIREGDEWKVAFRTNRGLFEPLVMFFGLTNSPATFQTMMNDIFRDLISEGMTLEEHRKITQLVLQQLRKHKLYLKPEKCEFERTRIEYLGLIILEGKMEMDPVKIAPPAPYQQEALDKLKRAVTSVPILIFAQDDQLYWIEANSSDFAMGAVLSQCAEDGTWHPVAFQSKSLTVVEQNYDIHNKELLAVIQALDEWRHFLEGTSEETQPPASMVVTIPLPIPLLTAPQEWER